MRARRVSLFRVLILIIFLAMAGRIFELQVIKGEEYSLLAERNRFRLLAIDAPRGVIYDRKGTILARNEPSFTVGLVPADLPEDEAEREALFSKLSAWLDIPVSTASLQMENGGQPPSPGGIIALTDPAMWEEIDLHYTPPPGIKEMLSTSNHGPYDFVPIKTNVERDIAFILEENHLNLPGVQVRAEAVRHYLDGPLTAHILGYLGRIPKERADFYLERGYNPNDRVGLTGVEYSCEDKLRGVKGSKYVEVDVAGREVRLMSAPQPPITGHSLVLTIDLELQRVVEATLQRAMRQVNSRSAVAIAMDPQTGEILALVSLPSYDNNLFAQGISAEDYRRLASDPAHPLVNHAISGQYPPGSVFKIVPAAAALQEEVVRPETILTCEGVMWVPNQFFPDNPDLAQPFRCWNEEGHGYVNFISGIAQSCDIYFYKIAGGYGNFEGLGLERLANYAHLFGLGEETGIDLPGESTGLVPTAKWKRLTYSETWVQGDTYNMGIGQGFVLATPLQILNAAAAIANGGNLYRPKVVREVVDVEGKVVRPFRPEVIRRLPISDENIELVRKGMRAAVTVGTAQGANLPHVSVAGKTGTAEFPGPRDSRGHLPTHAWFVAFAPYEDPKIALVVFIYGGGEGSQVAVPVAAEILNHYFPPPQGMENGGWKLEVGG